MTGALSVGAFVGGLAIFVVEVGCAGVAAWLVVSRRWGALNGAAKGVALGLLTVYGVGIARYGLFHMIDYAFFAGLAAYLALSGPYFDRRPELQRWRVSILAGTVAFSLMWTGIEKLLYPQWTAVVLAAHPIVTMGFPASFVTVRERSVPLVPGIARDTRWGPALSWCQGLHGLSDLRVSKKAIGDGLSCPVAT